MSNFIYSLVKCIQIKKKFFFYLESKKWSAWLLIIDWVFEENPQKQIIWSIETEII